jgi:hypothetical protein
MINEMLGSRLLQLVLVALAGAQTGMGNPAPTRVSGAVN